MHFVFLLHHGFGSWSWVLRNNIANKFFFKEFLEKLFSIVLVHMLLQLFFHMFWYKNLL